MKRKEIIICALGEFAQCKVGGKVWKMHIFVKKFYLRTTKRLCFLLYLMVMEVTRLLYLHDNTLFVYSKKQNLTKLENMIKLWKKHILIWMKKWKKISFIKNQKRVSQMNQKKKKFQLVQHHAWYYLRKLKLFAQTLEIVELYFVKDLKLLHYQKITNLQIKQKKNV